MNNKSDFDLNKIEQLELIGHGSFGEVYKVRDKKSKKILAAKISFRSMSSKNIIRDLSREVNILAKANHPCVIQFVGFSSINFHQEPKPTNRSIY